MEPADNSVITDPKPTFRGTAEAGSTVTVSVYGALAGITTADGSGSWSYMPVEALSEGFHTVYATAMDAAGNRSTSSAILHFTVNSASSSGNGAAIQGSASVQAGKPLDLILVAQLRYYH
ncbi:Ig-like domain-containing protein [Paenibacillus periandrae]|uniref:Ig-like domain-containing protein n=1 Tax=Paenibacillus periandrae TaxID=1761741 RepID=UPI001F08FAB0|nr:Ig-like domain-containing protein [Paenibacillus periandrae]